MHINISKFKEVLNQTNAALQNTMIKNKKENEANNKVPNNNNLQNNLNKALKELLKDSLFDDLFSNLYNLYITPFFESVIQDLKKGETPNNKSSTGFTKILSTPHTNNHLIFLDFMSFVYPLSIIALNIPP